MFNVNITNEATCISQQVTPTLYYRTKVYILKITKKYPYKLSSISQYMEGLQNYPLEVAEYPLFSHYRTEWYSYTSYPLKVSYSALF